MKYKNIIKYAWEITKKEKQNLFIFGFIPSLSGTIVGLGYISYQILAFRDWIIPHQHGSVGKIIKLIIKFLQDKPELTVFLIITSFFVFLMYSLSPSICGGALIDLISKKTQSKKLKGGLLKGFESFFPLLEFAAITSPFGIFAILIEISMVVRNFSSGTLFFILPVLSSILVIGAFLSLLFIFAEQNIVLENHNVLKAMRRSSVLVLTNVKDIFFLGISMILITSRIIVNIFLIVIIPLFFVGTIGLMTSVASKIIGVIVGTILGLTIIILGSYAMAIFHIFTYAVWTLSFITFRKNEEDNK